MNWQILISSFSLGLLSSFHCIGMCGALALSLPTQHMAPARKLTGILMYNSGRIFTYTLLGMLFGVIGRFIYFSGFQQWFSIIAGLLILLIVMPPVLGSPVLHLPGFKRMNLLIQRLIGCFLQIPSFGSMFILGMANGLLPCGLVYLAVTGAVAAGTISGATTFMLAFGAGTFPAMFLLSYFGFLISIPIRNKMRRVVPYIVGIMAILMIIRGMGLGIPYISPGLPKYFNNFILCP